MCSAQRRGSGACCGASCGGGSACGCDCEHITCSRTCRRLMDQRQIIAVANAYGCESVATILDLVESHKQPPVGLQRIERFYIYSFVFICWFPRSVPTTGAGRRFSYATRPGTSGTAANTAAPPFAGHHLVHVTGPRVCDDLLSLPHVRHVRHPGRRARRRRPARGQALREHARAPERLHARDARQPPARALRPRALLLRVVHPLIRRVV